MAEHQTDAHQEDHASFIKTPQQLVVVLLLAFVLPIIIIAMLAHLAISVVTYDSDHPAMSEQSVARRIKPIGQVTLVDPDAPKVVKTGEEVYKQVCLACHGTGVLNAPKVGDKAAWGKLNAQGLDTLAANAIKGIRQMPPRGGNPDLSDLEVHRAIVHMANQSGANWKEPEAAAAK